MLVKKRKTLFAVQTLACILLAPFPAATAQQDQSTSLNEASHLSEASKALADGRWSTADALLRTELALHPDSAPALYALGEVLFREDHPKESLATFTRAAAQAHPSAESLRLVALDYVLLNDYSDADRWITVAAQQDQQDSEIWYSMGRIKYTENRFQEAEESFKKSLALAPRSVKAENNLGLTYEALNRPEDAIQAYRLAIAWQQGAATPSAQPLLNLGSLETDRNALDDALALLLQAEAIAPGDGKIHGALGKLFIRRQELPEAQKELEQAVAKTPDSAALHFQLGQVYRKEGLEERSKQELKRAAELSGTHSNDPDRAN